MRLYLCRLQLQNGRIDIVIGHINTKGIRIAKDEHTLGIFGFLRQVQILGIPAIIHFSGLISLAVAIFNLIPFPALDGGHAVLLLWEGITGKRALKKDTEAWITAAGFAILILLILVVTWFDIQKLS